MHNMNEMWGLIYSHTMRTVHTSCHVLPHMQRYHMHIAQHMHAGKPAALCKCGAPEITYGHAICASQMIFIKINLPHILTT